VQANRHMQQVGERLQPAAAVLLPRRIPLALPMVKERTTRQIGSQCNQLSPSAPHSGRGVGSATPARAQCVPGSPQQTGVERCAKLPSKVTAAQEWATNTPSFLIA
jgi:hypothetical protein